MFTHIALLGLALAPSPTIRYPQSGDRYSASTAYRPRIELWTSRGDGAVYTRGERVRVFFKLDRDAFVTIFRVDTDGRVRVLFPREPWEDSFARGAREFEIDGRQLQGDAFTIDDYPGVGYLFAVASADPFVYDGIESGDHWDYRTIADGRVRGDPYVAMTDLAQHIVPENYSDWDYDIVSYNVDRHYDYPRFLCYDCHTYVSYPYWDPYYNSCVRFRMVIYDDPWYYPYRYYGGTRVVFVRPFRPQPRFIFKDWGANRSPRESFISRERERPVNDDTRRGVTGRDIGSRGVIPPPNVRTRRERPDQPGQGGQPGQPGRPGDDRNDDRGNGRRERPGEQPGNDGRNNDRNNDRNGDRNNDRNEPNRPNNDGNRNDRGTGRRQGQEQRDQQGQQGQQGQRVDRPMVLPQRDEQRPTVIEPREEPRRVEPRRVEPRREEPRFEPRREEPRRVEPRPEPRREEPRRAEPQRSSPPPPPPRAEPRRDPPREQPSNQPEVRRRKP